MLAATSELNPTCGLVTDRCEAGGGYQAAMEVKVISPEILMILEADVICVTEGSNHTTEIKHLRSWNIAESCERQGDVSQRGLRPQHGIKWRIWELGRPRMPSQRSMRYQAYKR